MSRTPQTPPGDATRVQCPWCNALLRVDEWDGPVCPNCYGDCRSTWKLAVEEAEKRAFDDGFMHGEEAGEDHVRRELDGVARAALVVYRHAKRVRELLDDVVTEGGWRICVDPDTGQPQIPDAWERRMRQIRDEYHDVEQAMDRLHDAMLDDAERTLDEGGDL